MSEMYPELASLRASLEAGWAAMETPLVQSQMQSLEQAYRSNAPANVTTQLENQLNASIASGGGPLPSTGGGGGGGGGGQPQSTYTPPPAAFSAVQLLEQAIFAATGVSGLGSWAADLSNRGASASEIIRALRYGTDQSEAGKAAYRSYLSAFPKMDVFLREGIFAGDSPELQYQAYRNTVREAAQRYNINGNLVTNDRIASFIEGRNSAAEIVDRMNMAATAAATTPPETMSVLRQYYNVQPGDLTSFYLDPDLTEAELTKRYTAARIGTEALYNQFDIAAPTAEALVQQGITLSEAQRGFQTAAQQRTFMQGPGDVVTQEQLIGGQFGNVEGAQAIERAAGARVGKFEGGARYLSGQEGVIGLRSAATR